MDESDKSRVAPQRVKSGFRFYPLQKIGLLVISLLEPGECLLFIAESHVSLHKSRSRNVSGLTLSPQFVKHTKRIFPLAGMGVGSHKHTFCARASMRNRNSLLENGNGISRFIFSQKNKSEKPKRMRVVGCYG